MSRTSNGKSHATSAKTSRGLHPQSSQETLGNYACALIRKQYQALIKQEKRVLADCDPEGLHDMRVASRRLRTALQVFERAVDLPKAASGKRLQAIAKVLGNLRDLDVQLADLNNEYLPLLPVAEQRSLAEVVQALQQERRKAFAATADVLGRSRYRDLKEAYDTWLHQPRYTTLADLPLMLVLPDLLNPLLSALLLHPAWLIPLNQAAELSETLHDLRKLCKHVRYQAEFFINFYGPEFQAWVQEIRIIQEALGQLQDVQVLQELLAEHLPKSVKLPKFHRLIQTRQNTALQAWEVLRPKYLLPDFRQQLRQQLLNCQAPGT